MKPNRSSITEEQRKLIEDHIDVYLKEHPKVDYKNISTIATLRNSIAATTKLSNVLLIKPVTEILSSRLSSGDEANEFTSSEASFEDPEEAIVESSNRTECIKGFVNTFGLCFGRSRLTKRDITYFTLAVSNELKCPPTEVSVDIQSIVDEYNTLHADDVSESESTISDETTDDSNQINDKTNEVNGDKVDVDTDVEPTESVVVLATKRDRFDSDDYVCDKKWSCSCVCQFLGGLFVIFVIMFGAVIISQYYM